MGGLTIGSHLLRLPLEVNQSKVIHQFQTIKSEPKDNRQGILIWHHWIYTLQPIITDVPIH
jgi:hypothetical protein